MKVGIVGAGFVAKFHVRALASVRGVTVVAVYALKGAQELAQMCSELGLGQPAVCNSIKDLCRRSETVCLFLPNFARLQAVQEIVASGIKLKGLIAEKPFARNVAEADEILALTQSFGCPTAYFENQIFMPSVINTRAQLSQVVEKMGPVSLVRTAEEHGGPHEPWFWDPTKQGGGVWCDMGCHSVAVGEDLAAASSGGMLEPVSVNATMALLKWRHEPWLSKLKALGVDYASTPAEDFAQVSFTFRNAQGREVVVLATDSWMYEAPGLRLSMEAMGPGYALSVNTLCSPAGVFISDSAAESLVDGELALEKAQASRGQLIVQPDEPTLYGYVGEWRDAIANFNLGKDGLLNFAYGARVVRLVMSAYYSHEEAMTIELSDGFLDSEELRDYMPLIQKGRGGRLLLNE
jgi:predicted dehydrogenase